MRIPSSLLKQVLKQAAVEVGKSAGSELKDGIKEAANEKGKEAGKQWTESAIEQAKTLGNDTEYIFSVEDAMEILREEEADLPDESEIDWTKEQLSQLSDKEFMQLALELERREVSVDHRMKMVDSTPLDDMEPHTDYLFTIEDIEEGVEFDIFYKITRHNNDLIEGSPDMLANSLFDYVKMYDIDPEGIGIATQESVDKYFKLEVFSKYSIAINDENTIRRGAYKYNIEEPDLVGLQP